MTRTSLRFLIALIVALATAQAAWSATVEGEGRLRGKSLTDSTLMIDQTIYRVTPNTRIHWADGTRVTLTALPAAELPDREGEWPLIHARFRGQSSGKDAVLESVELNYGQD